MYSMYTIPCPHCGLRNDRHKFCMSCYGSGRIAISERPQVVTGKKLLWFFAKVIFWAAMVGAFVFGCLAL
jgi:hypothetical protein